VPDTNKHVSTFVCEKCSQVRNIQTRTVASLITCSSIMQFTQFVPHAAFLRCSLAPADVISCTPSLFGYRHDAVTEHSCWTVTVTVTVVTLAVSDRVRRPPHSAGTHTLILRSTTCRLASFFEHLTLWRLRNSGSVYECLYKR